MWQSFHEILYSYIGTIYTIFFYFGMFLSFLGNDSPLLMFQLSYYSIAHYIRLLRAKLVNENKGNELHLKGSKSVLLHLHEASDELNSVFSFPLLFIITTKLVLVSTYLFTLIYGLVKPNVLLPNSLVLFLIVQTVTFLGHLLVMFHAADMPVYQVSLIAE